MSCKLRDKRQKLFSGKNKKEKKKKKKKEKIKKKINK